MSSIQEMTCEVRGCKDISDSPREYFRFPKIKSALEEWIKFCNKDISNEDLTRSYICSIHFEETAYINEIREIDGDTILIRILNGNAVPTLHPPKPVNLNLPDLNLDSEKYAHIKTQSDLCQLKIANKITERKLKNLEISASAIRRYIKKQIANLESLQAQSKSVSNGLKAKNVLSKIFSPSQIKILSGFKKTLWSRDDFAIGWTIRFLSNRRFYNHLTNQLNFPLPAESSIKRFIVNEKRSRSKTDKSNK